MLDIAQNIFLTWETLLIHKINYSFQTSLTVFKEYGSQT